MELNLLNSEFSSAELISAPDTNSSLFNKFKSKITLQPTCRSLAKGRKDCSSMNYTIIYKPVAATFLHPLVAASHHVTAEKFDVSLHHLNSNNFDKSN